MLRPLLVALLLAPLAGCLDALPVEPAAAPAPQVAVQSLEGVLTSAAAAERELVPAQAAGQAHREVYVANGTTRLTLSLETRGGELHARAGPRGCEACPVETTTSAGSFEVVVDAPEPGAWLVELRAAAPQAPEVAYTLTSTHERGLTAAPELYEGSVVAVNTGAVRVSPDQLGEVLREVWVPEGTTLLRLEVEASYDLDVVVGKWAPARDRDSEQSFPTQDGRVRIEIETPGPGGWYVIFFHPSGGPGVREVAYSMAATKPAA